MGLLQACRNPSEPFLFPTAMEEVKYFQEKAVLVLAVCEPWLYALKKRARGCSRLKMLG